jgi:hypothetical protein
MKTVRDVTYQLLREFGLTTIFGNVGWTEETFLKNFPLDFRYILALQESLVIGVADGYAQATRRPALVNLHTGAGLGNAMGTLITAFQNKTPLIVTAGQQTREMLLMEPWLTNVESTMLPRPWVKWATSPCERIYRPHSCVRLPLLFNRLPDPYSFRFRSTIGKSLAKAQPWYGRLVAELRRILIVSRNLQRYCRMHLRPYSSAALLSHEKTVGTKQSRLRRRSARRCGPRQLPSAHRFRRITLSIAAVALRHRPT